MDSSYDFNDVYIADTADILYNKRRQKCLCRRQYDPQFFVELKKEILKKRKEFTALTPSAMSTKETTLIKTSLQLKLSMK